MQNQLRFNMQMKAAQYSNVPVTLFQGTGSHGEAPFRTAYYRVGNIKAILKVPMLCLTATASTKLRKKK